MGTKVNSNYESLLTFTRASKGHALRPVSYGDELVENGDFSSTDLSDWTGKTPATVTLSYDAGRLRVVSTDSYNGVYQDITTVVGGIYSFTRTVEGGTGTLRFRTFAGPVGGLVDLGGISTIDNGAGSTETFIFVATSTTTRIQLQSWNTIANFHLDNISLKEVLFDQPDGTLTLFEHPDDVPRVEYDADGNRLGLLVEEQRTNLVTYSEDFTQSFYIKDANVSVTSSNNAAPSGVSNASLITASDNGRIYANNASLTGVVSVFVKAGTFANLKIKGNNVDLVAKTASAGTLEEVGGGWFRYTSEEATAARHFQIQAYPDDTYSSHTQTGTYYIWGAQLEAGSFPTSYIKNEGTSGGVTRSADVASIPVADFGFNHNEGTLFVNCLHFGDASERPLSMSDGSNTSQAFFKIATGSNPISQIVTAGVNVAQLDTTSARDSGYKAAMTVKENDFAVSVDGNSVAVDTNGGIGTYSIIHIGRRQDGLASTIFNGHIKSIKYYPRRLTNAQLQDLTS